jgi:hypothetical protein
VAALKLVRHHKLCHSEPKRNHRRKSLEKAGYGGILQRYQEEHRHYHDSFIPEHSLNMDYVMN